MNIQGWRTFLVDALMVVCLGAVAAFLVWKQGTPDTDILMWLATSYAALAGKSIYGKKQAGAQAIEKLRTVGEADRVHTDQALRSQSRGEK